MTDTNDVRRSNERYRRKHFVVGIILLSLGGGMIWGIGGGIFVGGGICLWIATFWDQLGFNEIGDDE